MTRTPMERLVVFAYLVLACLTLAHAVYYNYSSYYLELHSQHAGAQLTTYYQQHNSTAIDREHPLFTGTDHAPNQYRIAIPYLAQAIGSLTHSSKYYILYAIFDFLCALAASYILYGLLRRSPFLQSLGPTEQLVAVAFLLVSIAYPFAWVTSFERPETLPTALYLALMSLILSRARPLPMLTLASLLTIWQGFVRSDIPVVFAAAVLLLCGTAACRQLFGSRSQAAVFGAVNLTLALSVQFVLQHYLFPYATYPADTKLVQLMSNLHPRPLATFSIAILPYGFIVLGAIAYWKRLDALDQLLVLSSLAYLPLWFAVGADTEVRIFVPYLLALTPTAAKLLFLCVNAKGNRLDRR